MSFLEGIKRPWESQAKYKVRTGRGDVQYLAVPQQDGPDVDIYREGDHLFDLFKDQYPDRLVEIPASCHIKGGGVDWDQVGLIRDRKNPLKINVVLVGQD